jgi:hypothetical protein
MSVKELIIPRHIAQLRANAENGRDDAKSLYSSVDKKIATGRATCRCCGQKIAKGEVALYFAYDFTGSGSYTAVWCWMHQTCTPAGEALASSV